MIWCCVFCGLAVGLSVWAAWGTYQNTKAIKDVIDSSTYIIKMLQLNKKMLDLIKRDGESN